MFPVAELIQTNSRFHQIGPKYKTFGDVRKPPEKHLDCNTKKGP